MKNMKKKVVRHLKEDIHDFKEESSKDKHLIAQLEGKSMKKKKKKRGAYGTKVEKVMHEYKHGDLHSGSKKGPKVTNPKQAIAIALSEARKATGKKRKKKAHRRKHHAVII